MALKKYSRPLDLLIASAEAMRQGKVGLATKLFVKAGEHPKIGEVLAELDRQNTAAHQAVKAAAVRQGIVKAKTKVQADDDDLSLEELDLEESDLEGDGDVDGDGDLDDLLDDADDSIEASDDGEKKDEDEESAEGDDEKKDDDESSEALPGLSTDPREAENLNDEMPKADKNEPAKTQASLRATVNNLKALARLANRPKKSRK